MEEDGRNRKKILSHFLSLSYKDQLNKTRIAENNDSNSFSNFMLFLDSMFRYLYKFPFENYTQ